MEILELLPVLGIPALGVMRQEMRNNLPDGELIIGNMITSVGSCAVRFLVFLADICDLVQYSVW